MPWRVGRWTSRTDSGGSAYPFHSCTPSAGLASPVSRARTAVVVTGAKVVLLQRSSSVPQPPGEATSRQVSPSRYSTGQCPGEGSAAVPSSSRSVHGYLPEGAVGGGVVVGSHTRIVEGPRFAQE